MFGSDDARRRSENAIARVVASALVSCVAFGAGCQTAAPIVSRRLIEHQAMIDFSGLKPAETFEPIKASGAVPRSWQAVPPNKTALYTHLQWRSPSAHTAIGAAHLRLPLPLSAGAIAWLGKKEYRKKASDAKILAEWNDELGRYWMEGENGKYHVRGYVVAQGFEAWAVYFGYKITDPPEMSEISLAARSADTFLPAVGTETPRSALPVMPTTRP